MIDWKDFPFVTPEENRREAFRLSQSFRSLAALEEEAMAHSARIHWLLQKYIVAKRNLDLSKLSLDELRQRFEEICLVQDETQFQDEEQGAEQYGACYTALQSVSNELKRRGAEARRALCDLFTHPAAHVRLQAALFSYGAAPMEARCCLEQLRNAKTLHDSFAAGMALRSIEDGTWTPD